MWLIIVESPSKCRKIEEYLGFNYKCIASVGHFRALTSMDDQYNPIFSIMPEKKANVAKMRKTISIYDKSRILLATDDDREGEAIAWHICDVFGLSVETTRRIKFREITASAIRDAVLNTSPTTINMDLVRAQQTRQVLDMLVGFKVSPVLWKFLQNGLSAGRCQTPALRLILDNERQTKEIRMTHKVIGFFHKREFVLSQEMGSDESARDFLDKSAKFQHILSALPATRCERMPPTPYNTSGLLQSACNSLRMAPNDVMKYCQVLYQDGYITYMRTESTKYSREFIEKARDYINTQGAAAPLQPPALIREGLEGIADCVGRCAEGANRRFPPHEAIRPTNISLVELPGNDKKLQSLYSLIWKNSLASCMAPQQYMLYEYRVSAPDQLFYSHIAEIVIEPGWKAIFDTSRQTAPEPPSLLRGNVSPSQIKTTPIFHNTRSHYTEASLIRKLEELGIGRPSTFASLVEVIKERKYVAVEDVEGIAVECNQYTMTGLGIQIERLTRIVGNEKQKLIIQPIGITCIEFLISHFSELFSYDYTNKMEAKLDAMELAGLCRDCDATIQKSIAAGNLRLAPKLTAKRSDATSSQALMPVCRHPCLDAERPYAPLAQDPSLTRAETAVDLGENILLKSGKYGMYVEREGTRKSTRGKPKVSLEEAKQILTAETPKSNANVLRILDAEYSVRKGKYGVYVLHERKGAKPICHNIRKFRESFMECEAQTLIDWVKNISVV